MRMKLILLIALASAVVIGGPKITVLNSNQNNLQLHISLQPNSLEDFKPFYVLIGLPNSIYPELNIQASNKKYFNDSLSVSSEPAVQWQQIQKLRGLWVGTLKISPANIGISSDQYHSEMIISLDFSGQRPSFNNKEEDYILSSSVLNWDIAKNWAIQAERKLAKHKELPSGQWFKFSINKDGTYQINSNELEQLWTSISNTDPRSFMLFTSSNLGRYQSQRPGDPTPTENLTEIAFEYQGATDGNFSENDKLIFYGQGSSGFNQQGTNLSFNQNLYFNNNIYWLLVPEDSNLRGKRITKKQSTENPTLNFNYGIRYQQIEIDLLIPFESGLGWVELPINPNSSIEKSFEVYQPVSDITPTLILGFLGGTSDSKARPFPFNAVTIKHLAQYTSDLVSITWAGTGQRTATITLANDMLSNGPNSFSFSNISNDTYSRPYFDNLTLFYGSQLEFTGDQFEFLTPIHSSSAKYSVNSGLEPRIWNITDITNPIELETSQSGSSYSFIAAPGQNAYARINIFNDENIPLVENIEFIGGQDFHSFRNTTIQAEHIIIAPSDYLSAVNRLTAHRKNSIFAPLETIYNEFGGGNSDPMAIRNFIDWTQNNWQTPLPQNIFIIGDADYDYRNITGSSKNIVPTIEVGINNSYATDDRLAATNGTIPEVAIGRFPARNISEAEDFIEKLIEFETNPEFGLWRQKVTMIADDTARPENTISELNIGKSHTLNSEILAGTIPPAFEIFKLYMLEYPEESDASSFGVAKPAATEALFDVLQKGTAIVNYIGHGSAHQWAQERLLYQDRGDLMAIETGMKLPIWIAGTCSWGHFDNIGQESFSEELIRQPMNGASAIITTSRPITVTSNQYYEEQLFNKIFPYEAVSDKSIGVILQSIKTGNQEGEYFHLFGDPAMKLPMPTGKLTITDVSPDTLETLGESTFSAQQNLTAQGGEGFVILKDANRTVTREYNYLSNIESLSYTLPGPTLFRGKFSFNDNTMTGQFRIPKDFSFSNEPSSLKLYVFSNDLNPVEGTGFKDSLYIKSGQVSNDKFGPIISFETKEKRILRSGDHIQKGDEIYIRLTDPLGINLTGEMGHEIILTDNSTEAKKNITDDFIYDNNSITTGTIPLYSDENVSEIQISVKAWDSANNPAEGEIRLYRISEIKLKLFNVLNYPNPFSNSTQFTFELSQPAEVQIMIFTLGGRKIMEIDPEYFTGGFHTIDWNGRDAYGNELANGVYLYRLKAVGVDETASFIGRLAKYE